jgi:hypothetical protein
MLLLLSATPAAASWTITTQTATWRVTASTILITEARDAILWQREQMALIGAVFTAAVPQIGLADAGSGNSTLSIAMSRSGAAGADAWIAAYSTSHCPAAATSQAMLDCVDAAALADLRQVVYRYRLHLREAASPVTEPDFGGTP